MNKGDITEQGVFLGESIVDREAQLTEDEVGNLPKAYKDQAPRGEGDAPVMDLWRDKALAYVFDKDGAEVTVLAEDI